MTNNQAVPSQINSLKDIIRFMIRPLLRRYHLNHDVITGLVGDRGDGKSTTGAKLVVRDEMLDGVPCASNMQIKYTVRVPDGIANLFGLDGGEVVYESEVLDKNALLSLSGRYHGYALFVDEINIFMADARRAMSGANLAASDVGQELRKLQASLTYTAIDEMFVETRVRDVTDNFIRCEDTALNPEGLRQRKVPGQEIRWTIYPMSRKLTGLRYQDTHRFIGPIHIPIQSEWGMIDTWQKQDRKNYKYKIGEVEGTLELSRDPRTLQVESKWGWLYEKMVELKKQGIPIIRRDVLWQYLELDKRRIPISECAKQLRDMGIESGPRGHDFSTYKIDNFTIDVIPEGDKVVSVV